MFRDRGVCGIDSEGAPMRASVSERDLCAVMLGVQLPEWRLGPGAAVRAGFVHQGRLRCARVVGAYPAT